MNCLFDASSAVFLPLQLLHRWRPAHFTRRRWFLASATVAGALYMGLALRWYRGLSRRFAQMQHTNNQFKSRPTVAAGSTARLERPPIWQRTWRQQVRSPEFWFFVAFVSVHMVKSTSFLMINKMILADYGDGDQVYLAVFTATLPASVFCIPLINFVIGRFGLGGALHAVNVLGAMYALCALVHSLPFQLVTFALYTNYRAMLYSVASVFSSQTFGPINVGRMHGLAFTLSSLGCFFNSQFVSVTNDHFAGDFTAYSIGSVALTMPLFPLTSWINSRYLVPAMENLAAAKEMAVQEMHQGAQTQETSSRGV